MTREQILALEGEALDEACAVNVMGWEVFDCHVYKQPGGNARPRSNWHPHSDRNHAAEVLEAVRRQGRAGRVLDELSLLSRWELLTVPCRDICKAALLAVGEKHG